MAVLSLLWIKFAHLPVVFLGAKGIPEASFIAFILYISSHGLTQKTQWGEKLEEFFASLLTPASLPIIFVLAASSSIGEELLFRGAVQNQFGFIAASILFGLVHWPFNKLMIPWTIIAMAVGFVLGGLYIYAGNILAPIMLHFMVNFLNIWTLNQKYGYTPRI